MRKRNALFWSFLLLLLLSCGCVQETAEHGNGTSEDLTLKNGEAETATITLRYLDAEGKIITEKIFEVAKGTNAFEAMKENVAVGYDMYAAGAFVKSIADIAPPEGYYLALYVNSAYAKKGISSHNIETDTLIEWKTESIESFGME